MIVFEVNNLMAIDIKQQSDVLKFHCNYCLCDCSKLRISCAICRDFDLCLKCFASGAEMGEHKRDHDYRLLDNNTFPLISSGWSADEELLLLDAIEQHGLGNWDDISDHVGTKLGPDVQFHFEDVFLRKNIGKVTLPRSSSSIVDHSLQNGLLSPSLTTPLEPIDLPVSEQQELGYMPHRDDFEREYENEGESLVRALVCNKDDDEIEKALQLSHADMYWRVLKERTRWKGIARQFGLIASKHKISSSRRKLCREDRDFRDKIRCFAQFCSFQQWDDLVNSRVKERETKQRIKELYRYRRAGIKKLAACEEYEELKQQREKKKENKKRQQMISPPRSKIPSVKGAKDKDDGVSKDIETMKVEPDVICGKVDFRLKMKADNCFPLLSDKEKQLCCSIELRCSRYITLKTCILNEYYVRASGGIFKGRVPSYLTPSTKQILKEFFVSCGWICE